MDMEKRNRFGNVVQFPEFDKNVGLETIVSKIERVLVKNGFLKCHIPSVDSTRKYFTDNQFEGYQDLYKVISGDGQVLTLPNDGAASLFNTIVVKRNENARFFGRTETYSFLKPTNPQNGYILTALLTCADTYQAQAEMCALAIDISDAIGLHENIYLSNTEITQGIVDFYAQRHESKERVKKIVGGAVESESDYAAARVFSEMSKCTGNTPKDELKLIAEKIENKRSLDGILEIYEVLNMMEANDKLERISIDPLYIGNGNQAGTVFYIGKEKVVLSGGKSVFTNGQESMTVFTLSIDLYNLSSILQNLPKDRPNRVGILVANSFISYQKAIKFKTDFMKNGLIADVTYNVSSEEANGILETKVDKDYLVIYVDENGNVKHN